MILARLEGGPFDGDSGNIHSTDPPESLWAFRCPRPQECGVAVHWTLEVSSTPPDAEFYEHDRVTERTVHVYVWKDLAGALDRSLREWVREPAAA